MNYQSILTLSLTLIFTGALVVATGCDNATVAPNAEAPNAEAPDAGEEAVTQNLGAIAPDQAGDRSTAPVLAYGSMEEVGTSRLVRTDDAVATRTNTTELVDSHVTTLWWVFFNNPDACEVQGNEVSDEVPCDVPDLFDPDVEASCLYAGGSIVGGNGHARFQDRITIGEDRNSCLEFFGAEDHGLQNPKSAEVHVAVRSHGPIIPGMVPEMRSTYAGGCEDFLDAGTVPDEQGECADQQFAIHTPPE